MSTLVVNATLVIVSTGKFNPAISPEHVSEPDPLINFKLAF